MNKSIDISRTSVLPDEFVKEMLASKIKYLELEMEEKMTLGTSQSHQLLELKKQKETFELELNRYKNPVMSAQPGQIAAKVEPEQPAPTAEKPQPEKQETPPVKGIEEEKKSVQNIEIKPKFSSARNEVEMKLKEIVLDHEMSKIQRKILASMHGRAREMGFRDVREMLKYKRSRLLDSLIDMKKKDTEEGVINVIEKEIVAIDHLLEGNLEETLQEMQKIEKIQKEEPEDRKHLDKELKGLINEIL